jgi:hypothetical protein
MYIKNIYNSRIKTFNYTYQKSFSFIKLFHTSIKFYAEWNLDRINELLAKNNSHISKAQELQLVGVANKFDKHLYDIHEEGRKKPLLILNELVLKYKDKLDKSTLKGIDNEIDFLDESGESMSVKDYIEHMNEKANTERRAFNNILAIFKKDKNLGKKYFKSDEYKEHEKSLKDQWEKLDEKINNHLGELSVMESKASEVKNKLISIDPDKYTHLTKNVSISSVIERFSNSLVDEFADPSTEFSDYSED